MAFLVPWGVGRTRGGKSSPKRPYKDGELFPQGRYANKEHSFEKSSPSAFFSGAASRKGSPTAKFCGSGGESV